MSAGKKKDGEEGAMDALVNLIFKKLGTLDTLAGQVAEIDRRLRDQQAALQRLESQKTESSSSTKGGFAAFASKPPENQSVP